MSIDSSFSFDLYPGLDAELTAAYQRNVEAGTASPEAIANSGLAAVVAEQVQEADSSAESNLSPGFAQVVGIALDNANALFEEAWPTVPVVEPGGAELKHVDWERLAQAYEAMDRRGLEPELVISPGDTNPSFWENLYAKLPGTSNGGLYIDPEVRNAWLQLVESTSAWKASVISGKPMPAILNVSHDLSKIEATDRSQLTDTDIFTDDRAVRDHYPSLTEYLTLQAIYLKTGETPIDAETYTWLRGTFDNNTKAPYAYWRPDGGRVYVSWDAPGVQDDDLGVRPAVRG